MQGRAELEDVVMCVYILLSDYFENVGGHLKPHSKCENFIRRHLVSWQNHRYEPIECLVCQSQMHLSESYYLHIRRHHRSDPQYRAAMKHLIQVREVRLQKKCRMSIRCFKCDDMLTEYTIISHLRVRKI